MCRLDLGRAALSVFLELTDVWTDGLNWQLGHWLTGRLGAVSLAALVRHLCLRAGMSEILIDVSGLWGAVEGYVISALEAPSASISTLARHFGFDAVESEGCIRFLMRVRVATATITPDAMVAPATAKGDVMELTRAQQSELPQALKWQVARADEDYDAAQVEARRITVDSRGCFLGRRRKMATGVAAGEKARWVAMRDANGRRMGLGDCFRQRKKSVATKAVTPVR